jgi:hypothetical protein
LAQVEAAFGERDSVAELFAPLLSLRKGGGVASGYESFMISGNMINAQGRLMCSEPDWLKLPVSEVRSSDGKVANRDFSSGLARRDRNWSLNDGYIPNPSARL